MAAAAWFAGWARVAQPSTTPADLPPRAAPAGAACAWDACWVRMVSPRGFATASRTTAPLPAINRGRPRSQLPPSGQKAPACAPGAGPAGRAEEPSVGGHLKCDSAAAAGRHRPDAPPCCSGAGHEAEEGAGLAGAVAAALAGAAGGGGAPAGAPLADACPGPVAAPAATAAVVGEAGNANAGMPHGNTREPPPCM